MGRQLLGTIVPDLAYGQSGGSGAVPLPSPSDHFHGTLVDPRGLPLGGGLGPGSRFAGATPGGPPAAGNFLAGDWVMDNAYALMWVCTAGGYPGIWRSVGAGNLYGRMHQTTSQTISNTGTHWAAIGSTKDLDPGNMFVSGGGLTPPFSGWWHVWVSQFINPNPGTTGTDVRIYWWSSNSTDPEAGGSPALSYSGTGSGSYHHWTFDDFVFMAAGTTYWPILENFGGASYTAFSDGRCSHTEWQYVGNGN